GDDCGGDEGHRAPQRTAGRAGRLTGDGSPHEDTKDKRSKDMDAHVKDVVREMSKASDEERITFPEVVKALMEVGIERYHADLVAARKTYYLPNGDLEETPVHKTGGGASKVSAEGAEKAGRATPQKKNASHEFFRQIPHPGCV